MSKILVAGSAGFLGSGLALKLIEDNEVYVTYHNEKLPQEIVDGAAMTRRADLTTREDCRGACAGIDIVYMCAAITSGAKVIVNDPISQVTENVVMNARMLEAAWRADVKKFVFISSSTVYHDTHRRPVPEEESFIGQPHYKYRWVGWMKRYAEVLCRTYADDGKMDVCVIRPCNLYGPRMKFDPDRSHMTAALIRRAVEKESPFVVWGTGEDIRDLIYIDDFVRGTIAAADCTTGYLAVNIASGQGYSVNEVARVILRLTGHDVEIQCDPTKPTTIPIRLINTDKAKRLFGFEAQVSLEEGLKRTIEWYKKFSSLA